MGHFCAVFFSLIFRIIGANIFRTPKDVGSGPLISCYIFILTLFLLFYDLKLYPASLRPLAALFHILVEFVIAEFLMETLVSDFWFPLEIGIMNGLDSFGHYLEELLDRTGGWACGSFCTYLKSDSTKIASSYSISSFFLIIVMHAVRAIDLRTLKEGPRAFIGDICYRLKESLRRKLRYFGCCKNRRVKLKTSPQIKKCRSPKRYSSKEESLSDFEFGDD